MKAWMKNPLTLTVCLGLLVASAGASARVSLSSLQAEVNEMRATMCGADLTQEECDAEVESSLIERIVAMENEQAEAAEVICSLAVMVTNEPIWPRVCDQFGSLRLVGGNTDDEGRLEVYGDGQWGTVCDDAFDDVDAGVACRQLGYSDGTAVRFLDSVPGFERGNGAIHLDDLACTGSETRLVDCRSRDFGVHNCSHFEDVGVRCTD